MRCFKRKLVKVLIFICLFFAVDEFCGFLLEPASYFGHYATIDLKEAKGTVDTVFLGSSWTYMGYDCALYDEKMGTTSFNAGTIGQSTIDSYYYLKEILKNNPVKTVYYNIHHIKLQTLKGVDNAMVVSDRLSGINKWEHIISSIDITGLPNLLKSYRYRGLIEDNNILNTVRLKMSDNYKMGKWYNETDMQRHSSMGFIISEYKIIPGNNENFTVTETDWSIEGILDYNIDYLNKIVELCKKNQIELILVTPPFTLGFLQTADYYDDFSLFMESYARENNLQYWDFNKLKNSPFVNELLFTDTSHLNYEGAQIYTNLLCEYLSNPNDIEFYDRLSDRPDIYKYCGGVKLKVEQTGSTYELKAEAANDKDMNLLYRFLYYNVDSGEWITLQEYSENDNCIVTDSDWKSNTGFRVECKGTGSEKVYDAYSEKFFGDIGYSQGMALYGRFIKEEMVLHLVGSKKENAEYQFLQWQPDGSYKIIKDYSDENIFDVPIPAEGMYRYKIIARDAESQIVLGEAQFFIDTNTTATN